MIAVILIRGLIDTRKPIRDTLKLLRLEHKNHLVIVNDKPEMTGMIKKVKDYVTWGKINEDILKNLIIKRGRLTGNNKVDPKMAPKMVKEILSGKWPAELKHVFRLSPPKKGFERLGIKFAYPRGALGPRGDKINELLKRMI